MPTVLSVNLNKIALVRNSREGDSPNVCEFARMAIEAGAGSITVHPRPDQRHIIPRDVYELADLVAKHSGIEFNIEGNPLEGQRGDYPGFLALVEAVKPDQATLVPDAIDQLTSDHGFDLTQTGETLRPIIQNLKTIGVRVSLFMDPIQSQIKLASEIAADRIELYTGPYAADYQAGEFEQRLNAYRDAGAYARQVGLKVNAGHDLNLENLPAFLKIGGVSEVSIGHALTVESLQRGYANTVSAYAKICAECG